MTQSTYREIVDRVCLEAGILSTSSDSEFEDNTALPASTLKAKLFVDTCNRMLLRRLNKLFTQRSFKFNTVDGVYEYDVDALTSLEGITYHTMRCNTTGAAVRQYNQSYQEFREAYPDLAAITEGKPQWWIALATASSSGSTRTNKFRLCPTPDGIYEIEYWAKITAQPLVNAADVIIWPWEYEDVLILWARNMLEQKLGADVGTSQYAESALDSLRIWTTAPIDQRQAIRLAVQLPGGRQARYGNYDNRARTRGW